MNMLNKLINWYFSKNAFPYWIVFILDCFICYFAGIIVFWMYYHGAVTLGNIALLSKTIAMYMCFNLIGFRIFKTYTGIIRYSSFVDLQRVAMAMGVSLVIAEIMHYVVYGWDLRFVRLEGRQIAAMYVIATLGMWGYRIIVKTIYDVMFSSKKGKRALIYGINNGGVIQEV
jgi:FlaA1/EpsC-like NDP-sugar epimerase